MNHLKDFQVDSRLASDCIQLGYLYFHDKTQQPASILLLMNNKAFPWFVIVPIGIDVIDIDELAEKNQLQMLREINNLSAFFKRHYHVDKINFASIGNIVNQMHIHLVARNKEDAKWPGVVWGSQSEQTYSQAEVDEIKVWLANEIEFFKLN